MAQSEQAASLDLGRDPAPASLVFVHLSDLHFREPGTPLAQREAMLRNRLLDDIPKAVELTDAKKVTAILITGDIARAGQVSEYVEARTWLDRLCSGLGLDSTQTLTCPGNHDVDWTRLSEERKAANAALRTGVTRLLDADIDKMLADSGEVLAPMEPYQEFAAGSACSIENVLAWDLPPLPMAGGYSLAIRGASSVINSDGADGAGTMAVQRNQLQVERDPGVIRMLLIHHSPYFWRRENPRPGKCGNNIVLYGHTHEPGHQVLDGTCVEITAGAVHPEETEVFAVPSYNVIEVSVDEPDAPSDVAHARVRIFRRPFSVPDDRFLDLGPDPSIDEVVRIIRANAPDWNGDGDVSGVAEPQPPLQTPQGAPDPHRLVLSRYQRLGAGDRLRLLDRIGIPRSEIQGLAPHKQIREVAKRVVASNRVDVFLGAASEIEAAHAAGGNP
jgi:predicted phosphodiesterase